MSICSLNFLNFAPPECIDPDAGFYHTLFIMTSVPFVAPPSIYAYLHLIKHDPNAKYKTLAISLQFFQLVLGSVTTVILQTFDCKSYGHESHLKEQLTRNIQFFGEKAQLDLANAFVVVVGLGVSVRRVRKYRRRPRGH